MSTDGVVGQNQNQGHNWDRIPWMLGSSTAGHEKEDPVDMNLVAGHDRGGTTQHFGAERCSLKLGQILGKTFPPTA